MPRQKVSCLENRRLLTTTTKIDLLYWRKTSELPKQFWYSKYCSSHCICGFPNLKDFTSSDFDVTIPWWCKRPHRRHRGLQLLYCGIALTHSMHRNSLALTCVSVPFSFCSLVPCKIVRDVISFKDVDLWRTIG